ncbi:MAG TPA: hypothetical protein PKZ76_06040 [Xanthomonadaceae bacterium]|nr:hypothetical protein [Xanthomonadaceae bacterium]
MNRCLPLLAAALIAGCAAQPQRDKTDQLLPVLVAYPQAVKGFAFERRLDDKDPRVGMQLRYVSDSHVELVSDVFVYLGGIFADFDMAAEFLGREMLLSLEHAAEHGLYSDVELLDDARYTVTTRYGDNPGRHMRFAFRRDGEEYISHAHLFYMPPYSIKFRSTFPGSGNTSFDAELHRLAHAFMAEVEPAESIRCRKTVTIHGLPAGTQPWVSMDGLDVMLPVDGMAEHMPPYLLESMKRLNANLCGATPAQVEHSQNGQE